MATYQWHAAGMADGRIRPGCRQPHRIQSGGHLAPDRRAPHARLTASAAFTSVFGEGYRQPPVDRVPPPMRAALEHELCGKFAGALAGSSSDALVLVAAPGSIC